MGFACTDTRIVFSILTPTVDKVSTERDGRGVKNRTRQSRFSSATHEPRGAQSDEVVTREERVRRESAREHVWTFMDEKEKASRFRAAETYGEEWHADDDPRVRTDTTGAVTMETDDWFVTWVLAEDAGVVVVRDLHVEAKTQRTPPGGITSNLLRELSPSAATAAYVEPIEDEFLGQWRRYSQLDRSLFGPEQTQRSTRGRPRINDRELVRVALAYLDEVGRGPGATRRLAERLEMPEDTVRDRIRMCRQREFLGPTKQGRRGGTPGPALRPHLPPPGPKEKAWHG